MHPFIHQSVAIHQTVDEYFRRLPNGPTRSTRLLIQHRRRLWEAARARAPNNLDGGKTPFLPPNSQRRIFLFFLEKHVKHEKKAETDTKRKIQRRSMEENGVNLK